ncbi:putative purine-cytosine permease FCY2 [Mollisia scopiformis]|uniref:Putative purine-cytosine permease FCY2 n=1 Tax=Mollisia scopiformis TaxID=149040 RepID=A0A132BDF9_MOLSC|nr:putative purine-cytosine permease FCY2 [Mollisia scopiformis]KUJ10418.1 putative purine-cytosine permease FCY2 [Mollisia scopiformis]
MATNLKHPSDGISTSMKSDTEKGIPEPASQELSAIHEESTEIFGQLSIWRKMANYGVELRGVQPVPVEERTDTRYLNVGTWLGASMMCLLPLKSGILGTLSYGMNLRDTFLVCFFFSFLTAIPPCYMITMSPRTGMRQMIQARYSFGYYPNIVPVILNMCSIMGFTMISAVVGGQCLVAMSNNSISTSSGIVIISLISMVITMTGYKIMHLILRYAWMPSLVAIIICVGVGGKHLKDQAPTEPPKASTIISFASLIAGYMLPFGSTLGDYAVYMPPSAPRLRLFLYAWLGICIPSVVLMTLGAAIGATVLVVPEWSDAYDLNSIGGVMDAMLRPAGGFGRFVTLILALSVIANTAPSVYSFSLNFQILIPGFHRIPRIVHVIVSTAILIGVGIGAAEKFTESLEGFLGVISYWAAGFVGIQLTEWIVFRHKDPETYDASIWNNSKLLPSGIAALVALIVPFVIVIPSMDQIWYVGPIAKTTGDLGFEFALVITPFIYYPLRKLEIGKFRGGRL